jgi:hypothetical protein
MPNPGHNEGFHVLDDFICEAIHEPSVPLASPANQGHNEGTSAVEELDCDASNESNPGEQEKS